MLYELAIVVIQKFCNQDNVTSDFSSLFFINDTKLNPSDFYFLYYTRVLENPTLSSGVYLFNLPVLGLR